MVQLSKMRSDFSSRGAWKWAGYLLASAFVVLLAEWMLKSGAKLPVMVIVACLGLSFVLFSFVNIQIGFYAVIILGFLTADVERLFMGQYPLTSVVLAMPYPLVCFLIFKEGRKSGVKWFPKHIVAYLYFLLTAYMVVEIFNPNMDSFLGWVSAFWQRLAYIFLLLISCYIFRDLKSIRFFFKFLLIIIFITALYGCFQQWFGLLPFDKRWVYDDPTIAGLYALPGGGLRKFSSFTDPANFGTFMAAGAVACIIFLAANPFRKGRRIWIGIFTLFTVLGMSYSGTRTANFMLLAGVALYILMTLYQRRTQILAVIAGLIFLFVLYAPIYGNVTLNRLRSSFNGAPSKDASYDVRLIHRNMMRPYIRQHPFGGGVNTAGVPGTKYNPHHYLAGFPPDGAYFATALNMGWVGLLLECIFFFFILFYCVHYFYTCRNNEIKTYYAAMSAILFSMMLGSDAQFTISSVPQSLIFIPLIAIVIKLHTFDQPVFTKENI